MNQDVDFWSTNLPLSVIGTLNTKRILNTLMILLQQIAYVKSSTYL